MAIIPSKVLCSTVYIQATFYWTYNLLDNRILFKKCNFIFRQESAVQLVGWEEERRDANIPSSARICKVLHLPQTQLSQIQSTKCQRCSKICWVQNLHQLQKQFYQFQSTEQLIQSMHRFDCTGGSIMLNVGN